MLVFCSPVVASSVLDKRRHDTQPFRHYWIIFFRFGLGYSLVVVVLGSHKTEGRPFLHALIWVWYHKNLIGPCRFFAYLLRLPANPNQMKAKTAPHQVKDPLSRSQSSPCLSNAMTQYPETSLSIAQNRDRRKRNSRNKRSTDENRIKYSIYNGML